uniref:Pleckstrin homology domain containing, family N member 1 n=1 Tax=Nothobranchius rachovii TaxID=451742 RepID=A0A1A8S9U2_9TELE
MSSSRLFRRKNPQEGQEKSNSIINILCTVTPRKEMSPKDLQTIENTKWDPPFLYDPTSGWKKSSINVKNFGRMIHSSKVRFRFLHCQIPLPSSCARSASQMPYGYSPDRHSYLEPTDPDDQEVDYDNIWEYDGETGMIQPLSGISTHWTGSDFGARGLGPMTTQQRWS